MMIINFLLLLSTLPTLPSLIYMLTPSSSSLIKTISMRMTSLPAAITALLHFTSPPQPHYPLPSSPQGPHAAVPGFLT